MHHLPLDRPEWNEEQLRYRILRTIFERAGTQCDVGVSVNEIGTELDLRFEDLFRSLSFLDERGYLTHLAAEARVCLAEKGVRYIQEGAGRRRSLRHPPGAFSQRASPSDRGPD